MLRGLAAAAALAAVTAALIPLQWAAVKLGLPARRAIPVAYHRIVCALFGVRIRVVGGRCHERPLLIVANHVSWLDIPVIGALGGAVFVAKREVAHWPLFGLLARLQRSVFVDRARRRSTAGANAQIAARLAEGDPVVLFAEGTSSDGNRVLPFRSSLIGAVQAALAASARVRGEAGCAERRRVTGRPRAPELVDRPPHPDPLPLPDPPPLAGEGREGASREGASGERERRGRVMVQPLSLAYVGLDGLPLGRPQRPRVAWYGAMDLLPHLFAILRRGAVDVVVTFGAPLAADAASDRKALARALETTVRATTAAVLRGREAAGLTSVG